jgi:outer membrane protein OmpA-like peptidoglycan-associated protein
VRQAHQQVKFVSGDSIMRRLWILGLLLAIGACAGPPPPTQVLVVYYQEWSADLDDSAQQIVKSAATWANSNPTLPVVVAGYADPEGSPQANRELSHVRAQRVADALIADGVPAQRVTVTAHGSVGFAMDSQESRRVTISLVAP